MAPDAKDVSLTQKLSRRRCLVWCRLRARIKSSTASSGSHPSIAPTGTEQDMTLCVSLQAPPEHSMWRLVPEVPPEGPDGAIVPTFDHICYTREGNQIIAKNFKVSVFVRLRPNNQNTFNVNPLYAPEYSTNVGVPPNNPVVAFDGNRTGPNGGVPNEVFTRQGVLINPDTVIVHMIIGYVKSYPRYTEAVTNWNAWNVEFLKNDGPPASKCFEGTFFDAFKRINRNAITVMKYKKVRLSRDAMYKDVGAGPGQHPLNRTGVTGFQNCDNWIRKVNFNWNWGPSGKILKFGNTTELLPSNFDPVLFIGLTRPDGGPCGSLAVGEPPIPRNFDKYPVELCGCTTLNYEDC